MRIAKPLSRRTFLFKSAAASAGVATAFTIAGTKSSGQVIGSNDAIRIAVAGINGRGASHIDGFSGVKGTQVTYLVDPDRRVFPGRLEQVGKKFNGFKPKTVQDLRKALEDKEVDVVSIASTNHWHALLAIWACQAGKDVYVEKPCSHNVFEGRKLVEAARKYDRIVQHGTQNRSDNNWAKLANAARSEKYGKLLVAYGYASKPRGSIGFKESKPVPPEFDFDLWLGPAQQQPYHENIVHYNWHWFWDFGNGEIGNQGVHQIDIARWGMPAGATPKSVVSMGGRFGYEDQGQTPNTQLTIIDFGGPKLIFEDRGLVGRKPISGSGEPEPSRVSNEFLCEGGMLRDGKFFANGSEKGEEIPASDPAPHPGGPFGNFIDAVRSRKREQLNAEILEGHLSSVLCHLGNISYRVGAGASLDTVPDSIAGHARSVQAFEEMRSHLVKYVGLNPSQSKFQLGRSLLWNAEKESFGDPEADKLLTRAYRSPFIVPSKV